MLHFAITLRRLVSEQVGKVGKLKVALKQCSSIQYWGISTFFLLECEHTLAQKNRIKFIKIFELCQVFMCQTVLIVPKINYSQKRIEKVWCGGISTI